MVSVSNSSSGKTDHSQQPQRPGEAGTPFNANGWLPPTAAAGLPIPGASMMGIAGMGAGNGPGELPFAGRFPPPASLDLPAVREEYLRLWRESLLAQQQHARQQQHQAGLAATLLPETYHFLSRLLAATPAYFYEPLDPNRNGSFFSDLLRSLVAKVRYTEEAQAAAAAASANAQMAAAASSMPPQQQHHLQSQVVLGQGQFSGSSSEGSFDHHQQQSAANKRPRLSTSPAGHQQQQQGSSPAKQQKVPVGQKSPAVAGSMLEAENKQPSSASASDVKLESSIKSDPLPILKPIPVPPLPVMPRFLQTPSFKFGIPALTSSEPGSLKKRKFDATSSAADDSSGKEAAAGGVVPAAGFTSDHRGQVSSAFQPFTAASSSGDASSSDDGCQQREDAVAAADAGRLSATGRNTTSTGQVLKNLKHIYESLHDSRSNKG